MGEVKNCRPVQIKENSQWYNSYGVIIDDNYIRAYKILILLDKNGNSLSYSSFQKILTDSSKVILLSGSENKKLIEKICTSYALYLL